MKRVALTVPLLVAMPLTLLAVAPTQAATPISSCPYTITQPGNYVVTKDLTSGGNGIIIQAGNVTVDLNGHTISGSTCVEGIIVQGVSGVRISNGTLTNFGSAIFLPNANNTTITAVTCRSCCYDAIVLDNANYNTVRENSVSGCMGGITLRNSSNSNAVRNNTLTGNNGVGILIQSGSDNTITGNTAQNNSQVDLRDDALYAGNNGWRNNNFVTDNEPGIYAGPAYGIIR